MFEEAGVAVPTNWDEFLAAAQALTKDIDGDGATDQFGVGVSTQQGSAEMSDIFNFVLSTGGNWTNKDGTPTIDTPETIEGLARWKQILQEGLTPLDVNTTTARQLMIQGKVAMRIDGPWIWATLQGAGDDVRPHLKIAPSPFHPPVGGESNVIAMPKDIPEETKKLVWDFIYLLTRPEWQTEYTLRANSPAPRKGSVPDDARESNPYIDLFVDAMQEASDAEVHRTPIGLEIHVNEFVKLLHEQSQAMYIQDKSPEDAAADLQAATEELQARE
jgi:multiple sugar transport system substrate-binding protein